ncbi:hypothetical protein Sjap_026650 [Stephania japonica]|uniref:Uncharacterized protein n=1 Tax=Stephania japonica TaxID=461633 RepID=A0AAP0E2D8_9MAGN
MAQESTGSEQTLGAAAWIIVPPSFSAQPPPSRLPTRARSSIGGQECGLAEKQKSLRRLVVTSGVHKHSTSSKQLTTLHHKEKAFPPLRAVVLKLASKCYNYE